jgi:hypothetical protein
LVILRQVLLGGIFTYQKAQLVPPALLDHKARKETLDHKARKETLGRKAPLVTQVSNTTFVGSTPMVRSMFQEK